MLFLRDQLGVDPDSRAQPGRRYATKRCTLSACRVALIAATLLLSVPGPALAHIGLRNSTPSKGAQLGAAPREIRLTFTAAVEVSVARFRLLGPKGAEVRISPLRQPSDSADVVLADIIGPLEAGQHTVEWQVIGKDGHPIRGTITFVIAPGATGLGSARSDPPLEGGAGASVDAPTGDTLPAVHHSPASMPNGDGFGAESLGYVVIRWLQFTALLIAIGAVAFTLVVLGLLRRAEPDSDSLSAMRTKAAALGFWAAVGLLVVVLLRLYAQSLAMHGPGVAFSGSLVASMLTSTVWGWGWILQLATTILAIGAFYLARRERAIGWTLAAVACAGLAVTPALSGHAAASPKFTGLAIVSDALHVIGAAGWLGSLILVLTVGIPVAMRLNEGSRGAAVARLVNAFSPTALMFAGLSALTGAFAAWLHIGFSSALWESAYGQTLLIKLGLLSAVIATGAYNWLKVKPALGNDVGTQRIRRSATAELAVGVLVLIVTAVLVATPPPMEMTSDTRAASQSDSTPR